MGHFPARRRRRVITHHLPFIGALATMSTLVVPASSPFAQHLAACEQTNTVETFEVKSALPTEQNRFNLSLPRNFASLVVACSDDLKALITSRNGDAFALLIFSIWRLFLASIATFALLFLFGHQLFTAHFLYLSPLMCFVMLHWFICSMQVASLCMIVLAQNRLLNSGHASHTQAGFDFDCIVKAALQRIGDLELAARGYRLTVPASVVARLDQTSSVLHNARLRQSMFSIFQRQLALLSTCSSSIDGNFQFPSNAFKFCNSSIATLSELKAAAISLKTFRQSIFSAIYAPSNPQPVHVPDSVPDWLEEDEEPKASESDNLPSPQSSCQRIILVVIDWIWNEPFCAFKWYRQSSNTLKSIDTFFQLLRADADSLKLLLENVGQVAACSVDSSQPDPPPTNESLLYVQELQSVSDAVRARLDLLKQSLLTGTSDLYFVQNSCSSVNDTALLKTLQSDLQSMNASLKLLSQALCVAEPADNAMQSRRATAECEFEDSSDFVSSGVGLLAQLTGSYEPPVYQRIDPPSENDESDSDSDASETNDFVERPRCTMRAAASMFSELNSVLRHRHTSTQPMLMAEPTPDSDSDDY